MSVRARSRASVQRLALRLVDAGLQVMGDLRSRISPADSSNQRPPPADAGDCRLAEEIRAIGRRYPDAWVSDAPLPEVTDALAVMIESECSGVDPRLNGGEQPDPEPELPPATLGRRTSDYHPRHIEFLAARWADEKDCLVVLLETAGYRPNLVAYPLARPSEVRVS